MNVFTGEISCKNPDLNHYITELRALYIRAKVDPNDTKRALNLHNLGEKMAKIVLLP